MIITFPARIRADYFDLLPKVGEDVGTSTDCDIYEITRRSEKLSNASSFCRSGSRLPSSVVELGGYLPSRSANRQAFLLQPLRSRQIGGSYRFCGMASWRFQHIAASSSPLPSGIAVCALVFDVSEWARHAVSITCKMANLYSFKCMETAGNSHGTDRLLHVDFAFPSTSPIRPPDCSPQTYAIIENLAVGNLAIFGSETFADYAQFFQACAHAITLLPRRLRKEISIAAGFARPLPDVLIQYVDGQVCPPKQTALTGNRFSMIDEANAVATCRSLYGQDAITVDADSCVDPVEYSGRNGFVTVLGHTRSAKFSASNLCTSSNAWRMVRDAVVRGSENISADVARFAAAFIDRLSGQGDIAHDSTEICPHWESAIAMLRSSQEFPSDNPSAIADSISTVEHILAAAKLIANGYYWTPALTSLTRSAVAALRKIVIGKPAGDIQVNACFIRAIAGAAYSCDILAALIEAGDYEITMGVEQALALTSSLSRQLDDIRRKIARRLLDSNRPEQRLASA